MLRVMWQASAKILDKEGNENEVLLPKRSTWDLANQDAKDLFEKNEALMSVLVRRLREPIQDEN